MAIVQFLGTNTDRHNTWVHIGRDPSDRVVLGRRYIEGSGQKPEEDMERFFRRCTEERELRIAEESKDGKTRQLDREKQMQSHPKPMRKSTIRVFEWVEEEFWNLENRRVEWEWVRLPVALSTAIRRWDEWEDQHRRYNSIRNEWDICEEFPEDPDKLPPRADSVYDPLKIPVPLEPGSVLRLEESSSSPLPYDHEDLEMNDLDPPPPQSSSNNLPHVICLAPAHVLEYRWGFKAGSLPAGPSRALQAGQSSKIVKSKSASEIIRLCFRHNIQHSPVPDDWQSIADGATSLADLGYGRKLVPPNLSAIQSPSSLQVSAANILSESHATVAQPPTRKLYFLELKTLSNTSRASHWRLATGDAATAVHLLRRFQDHHPVEALHEVVQFMLAHGLSF